MPDREKIVTRLQIINTWATVDLRSPKEPIWSYRTLEDVQQWTNDAIVLLKKQAEEIQEVRKENSRILNKFYEWAEENNAVRPVLKQDSMVCGNCGHEVIWQRLLGDNVLTDERLNYCPKCGRTVKWSG